MSILITGMGMPSKCIECRLMRRCGKDDLDYVCMPASVYVEDLTNAYRPRPEYCPLVEVPPHGRLIDADALTQDGWVLSRVVPVDGVFTSQEMPINCKSVPTIIKAEGGQANGF